MANSRETVSSFPIIFLSLLVLADSTTHTAVVAKGTQECTMCTECENPCQPPPPPPEAVLCPPPPLPSQPPPVPLPPPPAPVIPKTSPPPANPCNDCPRPLPPSPPTCGTCVPLPQGPPGWKSPPAGTGGSIYGPPSNYFPPGNDMIPPPASPASELPPFRQIVFSSIIPLASALSIATTIFIQ